MKTVKKRRIPKGLKVFFGIVFIIYLLSGLIVGCSALKSREPFHGWLYYWNGPYKGKVVDLDTGMPIEGAVVAGSWHLEVMAGWPKFCDAVETTTDKNGEFVLPRAWCISVWPLARLNIYSKPVVFKPGYLGYPPLGNNEEDLAAHMPKYTGREFLDKNQNYIIELGRPKTLQERKFTFDDANSLFDWDKSFGKLPNLIKLINDEGRALGIGEVRHSRSGDNK